MKARGLRTWSGVLVVLCLALASCSGDDDDDGGSDEGSGPTTTEGDAAFDPDGVVKIGYDLVASSKGGFSWDPRASTTNVADLGMYHLVYGGLMRPDPDGKLVPELAESATLVDANTIEVTLREGIVYADGSTLTAEMVKAQLDSNLSDPELPAYQASFHSLETVEVTGELSLRLGIPDGTAAGWYDNFLGGVETVIVPPSTDFTKPSGAGPFTVTAFAPEVSMTLEKNPDYWDADAIEIGGIEVVHVTSEGQSSSAALNAGQVDYASIPIPQVNALGSDLEPIITPTPGALAGFQVCETEAPFDDPRVRVALGRAIDREAINDALFDGNGVPAYSVWPEGHRFYLEGVDEEYGYDPEAAKDLLAEAGHPDGLEFEMLTMTLLQMPEVAQIVQQQWEAIGVRAKITPSENIVQDFYIDRRADIGLIPVLGLTPRLNRWTALTTNNVCKLQDPKLNEMAAEVATMSSTSDEAVELWHEIQEYMTEQGYGIHVIYGANVQGFNTKRLADVRPTTHVINVPDMWNIKVKS